ncbi:MAG: glycosyl transferase family 2 [Bradyrhizobium sp.]|nr:glycosyl transferase family 2 [Bradyrhizobium sp.]
MSAGGDVKGLGSGRRNVDVSVVVVVHNMEREAPRTLYSLSASYQRNIYAGDFEVIVLDNGSSPALDEAMIRELDGNFRLIRIDDAAVSPAQAINRGLAEASGNVIGVMIDGARIVTPGLLNFARHGAQLSQRAAVATLGWYLGYDFQRWAMHAGYDKSREDALLASIDWQADGYRLFEIGTLDESSVDGWLMPISESNALFMRRELWAEIGGVDERFDLAGGGLLNLDLFRRVVEMPGIELVTLLGEGTFHQLHGGVATNASVDNLDDSWNIWAKQYEDIRGRAYAVPTLTCPRSYIGGLPRAMLARFARAAIAPVRQGDRSVEPPLGRHFESGTWSLAATTRPSAGPTAAALDLAHGEFRAGRIDAAAAVARLIRKHAPDEYEPQRLLSLVGAALEGSGVPSSESGRAALSKAQKLLDEDMTMASIEAGTGTAGPALEFTGERYTPEISGAIALEHLHRYAMARELVGGKSVLDIACGEGYGSSMLADVAQSVVGVDIARDTVDHASRKYKKSNLQFKIGDCVDIPLPDDSVDVVVSFETIEHLDQHDAMMKEVKRVLRPDGVVIISTPETNEYAAVTNGPNPHHVKELTEEQYRQLLSKWFQNVAMYDQRVSLGSTIARQDGLSGFTNYNWRDGKLESAVGMMRTLYFIAVASDAELPIPDSSLFEQRNADGEDLLDVFFASQAAAIDGGAVRTSEVGGLASEHQRIVIGLNQQMSEQSAEIANLRMRYELVIRSRSWRLTRPLRGLARVVSFIHSELFR